MKLRRILTTQQTRVFLAYSLACVLAAALLAQQPPAEPVAPQEPPPPATQGPQSPQSEGMQGMQGTQGMQMTCCPPSMMSKMIDKPGGMAMMWVCMALVGALIASIIAVLIALAIFLVRRSRVAVVAVR